jgi:hypothetical protein
MAAELAPRAVAPEPSLDPPNGTPLKATKAAIERKTTTAPAVSAVVAPRPIK